MSQPNLTLIVGKPTKNEKSMNNAFWSQVAGNKNSSSMIVKPPVRSLTEVPMIDKQPIIIKPPQPNLVNLIDGGSPHIPSNTSKNTPAIPTANTAMKIGKKQTKNINAAALNTIVDKPNAATESGEDPPPGTANQVHINLPKPCPEVKVKKWRSHKPKKRIRYPSKNITWKKTDANKDGNVPDTSKKGNIETTQKEMPQTSEASNPATGETNPGQAIPTLNQTPNKNITLKTKKSLQQEMIKQRLNWIKSDPIKAGNEPGSSGTPHEENQSNSNNDESQFVEEPTLSSGFTMATEQAIPQAPLNQRSSAGSFFKPAVAPPQTTQAQKRERIAAWPDIYSYSYPKGIPKSFLIQQMSQEAGGQPITADSPIWPTNNMNVYQNMNTPTLGQQPSMENMNPTSAPIFVETENSVDVQQPYSPSDVYTEFGNNNEPCEDSESSEQTQGQKRLSAFQRLGPVSQPKKPKLTINLTLNKEQPVREVVNGPDDDPDKYTPVHLRQDIITSKDDTVMKYLPVWPWRKNVGIRKSATARQSRSAMILEQEQMEEVYEKDNLFIQISVKGYPATWTKEQVLDAVLESAKGYSLIPCFIEFSEQECKFLTLRSRTALIVLHKTGFYIHKDGVELTITISVTDLTLNQIDFIPRIVLRKRVAMAYSDHKLNLKAFTLQNDISHFIYFPLNRVGNQSSFTQLQSVIAWDQLTELDLSHNRLTDISGFDLSLVAPRLKHLNLSHNLLEKLTVLLNYRQLSLKKIFLEGNPFCHDYIDPEHYIKVIRMMFPAVVEIDGVPIHQRGELPQFKQNYCPEEAMEVTEKFLETFFPLLDSGVDQRSLIQGMYEDNATLTVTYCYKLRYGQIYRSFRNLFLYARFLDEGETDSVVGAMAITKLISRWPPTEHDPYTFTVDVLHHTECTTIIRIGGILKLTAETLAEDEHLLSFTRTIVLYSEDGDEYKIQNEMVYWDEPTAAYARSAFRVNTISQKKLNLKIESTTDEDLRQQFLKIFMKLTTANKEMSERCLEMNNWNLKLALEHFTKLLKTNNLDSLMKDDALTAPQE